MKIVTLGMTVGGNVGVVVTGLTSIVQKGAQILITTPGVISEKYSMHTITMNNESDGRSAYDRIVYFMTDRGDTNLLLITGVKNYDIKEA